ncbi:hypothetical protein NKG94_39765 [Micromonospora sp. M12]
MSRTPAGQLRGTTPRRVEGTRRHPGRRGGPDSRPAARRGSRWRTPGWRLAGVGGLVALLTVAGLAVQTSGDAPPTASAAEVLTEAAETARQQPDLVARPGQFLFIELRLTYREEPAAGAYINERLQRWVPVGAGTTWQQRRRLESRPTSGGPTTSPTWLRRPATTRVYRPNRSRWPSTCETTRSPGSTRGRGSGGHQERPYDDLRGRDVDA